MHRVEQRKNGGGSSLDRPPKQTTGADGGSQKVKHEEGGITPSNPAPKENLEISPRSKGAHPGT